QLALAWLLARGPDIVPIPGTKRLDRLRENVGAIHVRLDAEDLRHIDEALPPGAAAGTRDPEPQIKGVYICGRRDRGVTRCADVADTVRGSRGTAWLASR